METQEMNKIIKNETSIFQRPIIPRECPTFDEETANYIRERLELYLKSWVLTKLNEFVKESVIYAMDKALELVLENEVDVMAIIY